MVQYDITARFAQKNRALEPARMFLLLCLLLSDPALANEPELTITRTDSPPVIDGQLNDEVWKTAARVEQFTQRVPVTGAPVSEKTEAYISYDRDYLYVAARLHDREAEKIVARELREDEKMINDDIFTVSIDSMLDRRNAFMFYMNSLGTKSDARVEDNSSFRQEWDGIWYGASTRDDQGWTVEFAIPFKTLSINRDSRVWGLELERYIRRKNEFSYWANYAQNKNITYVAAYGDLHGLEDYDQGRGLDIRPQMATRYRRHFASDDRDFTVHPGLEAIYKLRASLNASAIINPDFSNAVVDDIKTNLTRFDLFFPEQRDFFVRDADIFQFGGLSEDNGIPFFSRRIGLPFDRENPEPLDIDAGAKLSGRVGRYTLGLLNTQLGSGQGISSKNLSVARVTRDIHDESRIGGIMTWGNPVSGEDNGVAGVDYRYRDSHFLGSEILVADAWFMKSFSEGLHSDDLAYGLTVELPNDRWNSIFRFKELQRNFNPALGFVNRRGIRQYDGELRYRVRPENSWFRTLDWGIESSFTTSTDNQLESARIYARAVEAENHTGDVYSLWGNWEYERLNQPFEIQPGVVIPPGEYNFYSIWTRLTTSEHRPLAIEVKTKAGEFYNGYIKDVTAVVKWRPGRHFHLILVHQVFDIDLPAGDFEFEINRARFNINFTPTLSWANVLQQESENHIMTLQSQLRWIMSPGNDLTVTLN